ncbi:MAG: hypothetical protein ACR2HG_09690 [Pyrinomonadaceae bacterium]
MRKFLAVVKYEYRRIVLKWTFLIATLLFPLIAAGFAVVPALLFSIKGEPTRLVIVDQSGKVVARLKENLSNEKKAKEKSRDEALKDMTATREEQMQQSAKQFGETFVFED